MSPVRLITLFAVLAAFHCCGNWALPLIDRDEPRFADASREMRERGDLVVPFFNGRERYDKPPLIYWAQCAAFAVFGENEFSARLPSALFAAGAAVVIVVWGWRGFSAEVGWSAALIFSLSLQTIVHARAAVADMAMVFFVVVAASSGWKWCGPGCVRTRNAPGLWGCIFWTALGLGFLAKGPIALLPLGMVAWRIAATPAGERPRWWEWPAGAALMFAVVAA